MPGVIGHGRERPRTLLGVRAFTTRGGDSPKRAERKRPPTAPTPGRGAARQEGEAPHIYYHAPNSAHLH